ncbi:MAG TPA: hypothetical protein VM509_00380 [Planctomycetota bacterium]|nr:hypothetical protein [Planctomycetota bacterium]
MKVQGFSRAALLAACFAFAPLAVAQEEEGADAPISEVMLLKLSDGSSLWGRIMAHDGERVSFQRIENGGIVRLPWKQLEARQSGELLEAYGYVDHSGEELTVEVDRLELDDGTEVIGRIVSRTDNEIYVKTADRLVPVPKKRISGAVTSVVVPALDVYTRDELYRAEAEKLDATSAKSQFELAKHCERIFDFTHAFEHYKAAQVLDPEYGGGQLKNVIPRMAEKAANQVQLDYLYQVDSLRARGQFDAALKNLEAFAQKWPDSNLRAEADRKKKQVEKSRLQAMRELVVGQTYKWAERLTTQQARVEGATLEQSLTYASEKLKDDLLAAVTKDLKRTIGPSVTPEEVKKLWEERKRGRFKRASYGQGTWLLGEAAAMKEYGKDKPKAEEAPKTGAEAERDKLEAKIKRYMDNQRIVSKKQAAEAKEGEESEQEIFWRNWTSFYRGQWLLAYYAENGGDLKIVGEELTNCHDCGGTGTREMINTGSARSNPQGQQPGQGSNSAGLVVVDCPTCHRIGRTRLVKYW